MTTNTKETVKSCGCRMCRSGKSTPTGTHIMKTEERAARRKAKIALKKDPLEAIVAPAHRGSYTD